MSSILKRPAKREPPHKTATESTDPNGERARSDSDFPTSIRGLDNARTRIVGYRTGFLADAIVSTVRFVVLARSYISRLVGRVTSVVTALGWIVLILIPATLIVGYSIAWTELVVAGYAFIAVALMAAIYLLGRSQLDISLHVNHGRVVVGESATGEVRGENNGKRRSLGVVAEVPVAETFAEVVLPSIRSGGSASHEFPIPTHRRGVISVGPVRTVRADPIGLVRRELVWTESAEVFVHPRTISIPSVSTGLIRDLEGNPTKDLANNDISFHALREYLPGDERRNIHWKTTARTGRYMVRQFEETRRSHLVIALSLATTDFANEYEFEMAVSVAGSLGSQAIRDARTVTVVASEQTPQFAKRKIFAVRALSTLTGTRLLDDLTRVQSAETALRIVDVARVTAEQTHGVSVAFLICGSRVTSQQLRAASTKFAANVEVVAIVCDPETVPGLRRVAGLSVLTIGYLEDLKRALARSAAV
ncbi:DUF58 domain-containing protein [Salinibacterium sp. M195]|uniref:DUF58 domain-containing protein n=1 Tax=Salinibacterium sp. M195 TaxID=2583374 RepID=UPI0021026E8D|nr:DUF58 domain-containing protein [Salinibacterium sp. M195]QYH36536.1 DUF58 domain-containing protein [Salinibacterium sp. M195]